ncbi:glycoside hydrolase family 16 protein [Pseudopedobacter beijingensis]|uniref:Glycoside hydrolase family 16 protein n=1 Tax=Pseudopedobacter beijingensis TaxID=1207056 RepID=A0ABW4I9T2_9SPHI
MLLLCVYFPVRVFSQVLFDDFKSTTIDTAVWKLANEKWGPGLHGGVVPSNVFISDGKLVIRAHGNDYKGHIQGHGQPTRVGGAIFTKEAFASGSFEIRAKICPQPGALSAFWTFYYKNDSYNHEIDFEFPGHNQLPNTPDSSRLDWGLLTNWRGIGKGQYITVDKYFGNQTDGNYHLYRFDWHTGGNNEKPRIEWYYDNKLIHSSFENIPNHASNYWIGVWFPIWIKPADFDTDYLYVDWVKITPFHEPNDLKTPLKQQ